jgi:hypothetical protein
MSRSKRFSGNLIVQPEAIENASEQGGFGVLSCVVILRQLAKPGRYTQNPCSGHFERNRDVTTVAGSGLFPISLR